MSFWVGGGGGVVVAGGDVVVVVVVGVVVVEGASLPALPHPAVIAPMAMSAAPPATAMMQRRLRLEVVLPVSCRE